MGKKKELTIEDVVKSFQDVIKRASLNNFYYINNIILSKDNNYRLLLIPDQSLWEKLINDKIIDMKEINLENPEEYEEVKWFRYGEEKINPDWINIDVTEDLFTGKIFKIKLKSHTYDIPINRDLMPLKLKKAEYDNVSYKVFNNPLVLGIKKRFNVMEDCGFTIIRLFQII